MVTDERWHKEKVIPGAVTWHGYTISCDRCGSQGPWTLRVQSIDTYGLDTWLICPDEHNVWHPLIYPDVALRLLAAPDVTATLDALDRGPEADWYPRIRLLDNLTVLDCAPDGVDPSRWSPFVRTAATQTPYFAEHWPDLHTVMVNGAGQNEGR